MTQVERITLLQKISLTRIFPKYWKIYFLLIPRIIVLGGISNYYIIKLQTNYCFCNWKFIDNQNFRLIIPRTFTIFILNNFMLKITWNMNNSFIIAWITHQFLYYCNTAKINVCVIVFKSWSVFDNICWFLLICASHLYDMHVENNATTSLYLISFPVCTITLLSTSW